METTTSSTKKYTQRVIKVAIILAIITSVELLLAFIWPDGSSRTILNIVFLLLTILKAFYIVGEFMHLKHEVKLLVYSIVIPLVLILFLIAILLTEGEYIFNN